MAPASLPGLRARNAMHGFTLVEAMVAMAVFTIGFASLFMLYTLSQQTIIDSEKRMHMNLMADRIIQTIAANGQLPVSDPLNAFVYPSKYSGSLKDCTYPSGDVRQSWCQDLNTNIGPLNPASGQEVRQVDVQNDGTGLIVNVTLITSNGNVAAYFTRKLRQL